MSVSREKVNRIRQQDRKRFERIRRELKDRIDYLERDIEHCVYRLRQHERQALGFVDDVEEFMERDPLARYQ